MQRSVNALNNLKLSGIGTEHYWRLKFDMTIL